MNGADFAFLQWVIQEEQSWNETFGDWPWTHVANEKYLWRWRVTHHA